MVLVLDSEYVHKGIVQWLERWRWVATIADRPPVSHVSRGTVFIWYPIPFGTI